MLNHQGKLSSSHWASQSSDSLSTSYKGAHLLLVEDNEINQQVAIGMLGYLDITLDVVNSGREAINTMVEQASYDGILMDLHMPDMGGLEATRIIRQNPKWKDIPIIAMTASSTQSDKEQCTNAGMNDHISKPIMPTDLLNKIARWIKTPPSISSPITKPTTQINSDLNTIKKATYWKEIDAIAGLKRLDLNQPLYHRLLLKFAMDYQDIKGTLETLFKESSSREVFFQEASQIMHSVKGVSGNLGIVKIQQLTSELEQTYKAGELQDLSRLEDQLKLVCDEIHQNLGSLTKVEKDTTQELTTSTALLKDLAILKLLLEEYDSEAKQILLHMLQTYGENTALKPVSNALEEYNFDHAYQLVEKIEQGLH